LTPFERDVLVHAGLFLGRLKAGDLADAAVGVPGNVRAKRLGPVSGMPQRVMASACNDNDGWVRAARTNQQRHLESLDTRIGVLEARTALLSKEAACGCRRRRCEPCGAGYADEHERLMKRRRLDVLRAERDRVARDIAAGRLHLVVGGRRLANTRHHLPDAGMSVEAWATTRERAVFWFGCQGNTGRVGGNPVFRLAADDPARPGAVFLTVRLPDATARRFGIPPLLRLVHPFPVVHRRSELLDRVTAREAVTYDLTMDTDGRGRERVFLAACWTRPEN
jgi:hypothetical protein